MSGSVTPARRSHDDSEDDEEDSEVSMDGQSLARSTRNKRARLDETVDEEDGAEETGEEEEGADDREEQDAPLLPDSFRRSPKRKSRAVNGHIKGKSTSNRPRTHQPGSIVRVTLTDFVTYTKVEFNPGPNLNMVIGPNGTGKSTLVCAICIGLGWATKHLGRGKDLDEFVKHGAKQGLIEIELAADPQRHQTNPVIATRIKKGDKANAEYWIDGKKENKKRVHQLCASFSIQVDNLCQFLPQDRVVEFAGLSPVELLTQTQRAAAPQHMSDWHDQLKNWRKEQKEQQLEQQSLAESIKQLEDRHRQQEPDVQRFEERAGLQERSQALQKLRPLPEYNDAKKNYNHAKERRKEAVAELKDLERRTRPNRAAILHKQDYVEAIVNKALPAQGRMVEKVEASVKTAKKKIETAAERISECNDQIEAEKNSTKAVRQSMPQLQRNVSSLKKALETPPQPFDPAEMNEQIRQNTRQVRALNEQVEGASQEVGSIGQHIGQRERTIDEAESEKRHLDTQAGQQAQKLDGYSKDLARAWRWIQDNRGRFQGEVFGPPLVECKVKDERHAPAVESMLQPADALAFTVTTKADFDMLTDQIRSMKLRQTSVRASLKGLDTFRPPTTNEALRQYGLEGWLLDLLEGPEPVLAMLCDNRNMHQAAYTFRDISSSQFNALQQSPISSWVTAKQSHTITRRREYGDKATSTRVQDLRPARFWKDVTVDLQQQSAIDRRIAETKSEISELKQSRLAKMGEVKTIKAQVTDLEKEKQAIESEKRVKQSLHSQFNALPTKLEHAENKLNEAKKQIAGSTQRLRAIRDKHDALCLEKGQCALDYANAVESWRGQFVKLYEMEILGIEANSDLTQLKAQNEEEEQLIRATQQERDRLAAREAELLAVGKHLQQQCLEVGETLSPSEHELWAQLEDWSADQLNTELVSLDARLESLIGGGNANAKREYEDRAKEIEKKSVRFHRLQTALDTLDATIAEVREKWEPELDALVEEISGAFAENFSKIQCAGEVGVYKDEDFEQWAIQIKVKFRENEPLSLLDSHRQSGGERAVSTIFYLMALQSLARAPFRVVDEINQGMDPRNERLVHSRMVDIACAEVSEGRQGSQYFLITPKLLQGLKYHSDMKVHCIASGEHMPDDFREIDFASAAKRALELRGRQAGVAAG